MFTLIDVLIDALWIMGLAGVLATFSYVDYLRSLHGWRWRDAWQRPVLLMPLSLSLTVFCIGLALNGATAHQPDPWWQTAIWSVMALLFAWQTVLYGRAGKRRGWDAAVDAADIQAETTDESKQPQREERTRVEPGQ